MLSHCAMFHNQSDGEHDLVLLAVRLKQHQQMVGEPIVTSRFISLRQQPTPSVLQRERCRRPQEPQVQAGSTTLAQSVGLLEVGWERSFSQLGSSHAGDIAITGVAETSMVMLSATYAAMAPVRCRAR
jgi:hypothetical protein